MRRPILLLPFCLAAAALAGCGNKGPLYLPAKPAVPVPAAAPAPSASTATPAKSSAPAAPSSAATPTGGH